MTDRHFQRYDHYYAVENEELIEGHIFCTIAEGVAIEKILLAEYPEEDGFTVNMEPGGEYDYTTEDGTTAEQIAQTIISESGFTSSQESDEDVTSVHTQEEA